MAHRKGTLHLVERIVGSHLRELLSDTSVSFDQAAVILREQHDVAVTSETLRRWSLQLGFPARGTADEAEDVAS